MLDMMAMLESSRRMHNQFVMPDHTTEFVEMQTGAPPPLPTRRRRLVMLLETTVYRILLAIRPREAVGNGTDGETSRA